MTQLSNLILLDACCLLNLYATGRMRDIAIALSHRLAVVDYVLEEEALFVWGSLGGESREKPVPVDLSPWVTEGLIQVLSLEHQEEEENFVDLAALIDDGEAMTGALALYRGCALATDDRKARRILSERAPTLQLISTLDLLKQWADQSSISRADLRAAMSAMQSGASYIPGDEDSLFKWWRSIMSGDTR